MYTGEALHAIISQVEAFVGDLQDKARSKAKLEKALQGVQLALIPAGVPRKPGMTRDDLFNTNAGGASPAHLMSTIAMFVPAAVRLQRLCGRVAGAVCNQPCFAL